MSVGAVNKQTGDRIPTAGMPAIDDALDLTSVNPVQNAIITAALANKQDKTDNSLQTTDKTVVGAINEVNSNFTSLEDDVDELKSGLMNYQTQNDINLEVPNRKNIAAGVASFETTLQFATALYVDCNLKPSTTYTLSFDGTEGNQLYTNENIFVQDTTITIGSSRTSVTVTTKSTIPSSEYTEGMGWRFLKNKITEPNDNTFTDVQLEYGSTATAYAPYIPSVESRIEALNTVTSSTAGGFGVFTVGKLVMLNKKDGGTDTDASGNVLYNGEALVLSSDIRPVELVTVLDAYGKKRIQIKTNGNVVLPDDASATNLTLRFTATYLTS